MGDPVLRLDFDTSSAMAGRARILKLEDVALPTPVGNIYFRELVLLYLGRVR